MKINSSQRLESLDILRGLDLFLLVFLQPILMAIGKLWNNSTYHAVLTQFEHVEWEGFRLWDLIMPLFLFMTGITIPFSLDKKIGNDSPDVYRHIVRRFLILWIIGMVVQGNILAFDWHVLRLYSNTLQAIATGYLFTSIAYLHFNFKKLIGLGLSLLIIYSIPMSTWEGYEPNYNFAIYLDKMFLQNFMDGVSWQGDEWIFSEHYHYTWIWSSLTFVVTVLMGCLTGKVIKDGKDVDPNGTTIKLVIAAVVCIVVSLIWNYQQPIIKKIWTGSMTLFSGGICILLMAIFYYIIDVQKNKKPFRWLKIYGMNSIVAYGLAEVINFRSLVHSLTFGLEEHFPDYSNLILTVGNYGIVLIILIMLYKRSIFVKI
ncbi:acyltransferase family protein [Sphingobacterium cellulitidis]|uniref:acyltransferase family protein n=1 Tax=Sphingobacterium cellulitidis TaxID=1768011 RepID=UPI00370DA240